VKQLIRSETIDGSATIETGINLESGTLVIKNATGDSSGLKIFQDSSDAAKIHNNYNGTLQLGVNNATTLTLDSTSATFAGTVQTTGVKTPYIESAATNQSLFLYANGSGHIYFGDSTNGTNLYHYSNSNDGKYTSYGFDGNYYTISTTATSGVDRKSVV